MDSLQLTYETMESYSNQNKMKMIKRINTTFNIRHRACAQACKGVPNMLGLGLGLGFGFGFWFVFENSWFRGSDNPPAGLARASRGVASPPPKTPKTAFKTLQDTPRHAQDAQDAPKTPKHTPKTPQNVAKTPQVAPKRPPRDPQEHPRRP